MVLGQLDIHKQKSEAEHPFHVIYKKKKPLEGNTGINLHDLALGNEFSDKICKAQMEKKNKTDKLNLTRILKLEGPCSGLNSVLQKFKSTGNLRM